ncbi:MAG: universal stress protein [Pseudonocardia sp.]|nr:universal stress protein [Pseudonocardia sp.]
MTTPVPGLPFATEPHVAVGVDGTRTALHAVRWATDEALSHGVPLLIVHAAPYATGPDGALRAHADRILGRAFTVARQRSPALTVRTARLDREPVDELGDLTGRVDLLVLGMPAAGPAGASGSVAVRVVARATGAVAVVHDDDVQAPEAAAVVAGIDDVPAKAAEVVWAAHEFARRHRVALHLVHAARSAAGAAHARDLLEPLRSQWDGRDARVPVTLHVVHGRPLPVLVEHAVEARLLVVGTAASGWQGMLGSTSRTLVRAAPCPVLVTGRPDRQPTGVPARDPQDRAELW